MGKYGKRRTVFVGGMGKQEVQRRLDEASKWVSPDNQKFLPAETQDRTGLEMNPLWMLECLVRSGTLPLKEQVSALKILADYTHSKAPSVSHNTSVHLKAEDWLKQLAETEYPEVSVERRIPAPEGQGPQYEWWRKKRLENPGKYTRKKVIDVESVPVTDDGQQPTGDPTPTAD